MPAVILSPCSFCRWCTCWPYRIIVLDVNDVHAGLIASLLLPLMLELTAFVLSLLSWMLAHASFIASLLLRLMQPSLLISLCCSYVVDVHATLITLFFLPFMLLMLVATYTQHTYARTLGILTRTSTVCRSRKGWEHAHWRQHFGHRHHFV